MAVDFRLNTAPYQLGEIVVSASRHAENIVDAPSSISKVNSRAAQNQATGLSVSSMLRNVKGVSYSQANLFEERINARGFSTSLYERMLLIVDGRLGYGLGGFFGSSVAKDDVKDVEIIVGPESALYGPDAVAGVVSITTKDPRNAAGTSVAVAGGTRDFFRGRVYHSGTERKWGWKISGEDQRARDYDVSQTFFNADSTASVSDDPNRDIRSQRAEAALFYYPDSLSRLRFSYGFNRADMVQFLNTGRVQREDMLRDYQQARFDWVCPDLS